ncbi:MAG: M23 family metallopeptidase [Hyphomicrobiaceae bacterium]
MPAYSANGTRIAAVAAVLGLAAGTACAQTPGPPVRLSLPLACTPGQDCFVQRHLDVKPGPGIQDPLCGEATGEDHTGVDFRISTLADVARDVAVLAPADGVVLRRRDGMPDRVVENEDMARAVTAQGCGNAVIIDHGGGLETQYCHLRSGSVRVTPGQKVMRGETLAGVGYSGLASFAHLHFGVRRGGKNVDPFTGTESGAPCRADPAAEPKAEPLFEQAVLEAFPYRSGEIFSAGFTGTPPKTTMEEALPPVPMAASPALLLFARVSNARAGDRMSFKIKGPAGFEFAGTTEPQTRGRPVWAPFAGKRLTASRWPAGRYEGVVELIRDGRTVHRRDGIVVNIE